MFDESGNFFDETDDINAFWEDVAKSFEEPIESFAGLVPIYSNYEGGYESSWYIVYRDQDGKLLSCYGSHCSCHGFEDQWGGSEFDPEDIDNTCRVARVDADRLRALVHE